MVTRARRILLIDDDRLQHHLVQGFVAKFRSGPWELEVAGDYDSGLKKLLSGKFSVCLLDYRLGERDGLELLREARSTDSATPVVFLTADASDEIDDAAMEAGAMDYLVKGELNARILEHSIRYARKLGETMGQLKLLATRDALTGLHNRREFDRMVAEECQRATRFGHPFALVMADIDFFKKINDTHGHQVGDEVLKHVASLLAGQLRVVDRIARYGGEEFAILMVETDRKQAVEGIQRLFALLAETPCQPAGTDLTLNVTLSAGLAIMPDDAASCDQLISAADKALYAAKHAGRNRVVTAHSLKD
ncbi:MAG: diguanylate cyclase [Candidatus Didemnitutus sp.]|nr:diguanylate cyclase [Candidatus Didemnitutus sp.]